MTLLQQMNAKLARRKEIQASAEAEGRELNEAEAGELKTIAAACVDLKAQIEQEKQFDAMDAEFNTPQGRRTQPAPVGKKQGAQAKDEDLEAMGGFADEGEFFMAVKQAAKGQSDPRLVLMAAGDNMTNNGEYGFEIPVAIRNKVISIFEEDTGDLLSRVDSEPTAAASIKIPKNIDTPWNAKGLVAYWEDSGSAVPKSKLDATNSKLVEINPLSIRVSVSDDLLEDAPRLGSRLLSKAPELLRWEINEAIRNGDGTGKLNGYRKSAAMITVPKESGQAAGTLTAANIFAMLRHLSPAARKRAVWLINPDLEEELAMLKGPDNSLIFSSRNQSMAKGTDGILKGRPVIWDEHAEEIGTEGDVQLIVPDGYYFAYRTGGPKFAQSMHVDFDQAAQAFRWRWRVGGGTFLDKPYSAAKSQNKRTHFVQLGARA
jgi:HK97 family phage major capsid protein